MKYTDGMWLDGKPNQNPLNTTRENRNVVFDRSQGSIRNEKGTILIDQYGTDKKLIGVIVLDNNDFVVFNKIGDISIIGYVDSTLKYRVLSSDINWNFDVTRPIHGTFQRNNKSERIIIWTDGVYTRYTNIDKPISVYSSEVFQDAYRPELSLVSVTSGGNLKAGAYYPIFRFEKEDGVLTSWFKDYTPAYVFSGTNYNKYNERKPNEVTDKSIDLSIHYNNANNVFIKVHLGFVLQINNVRTAHFVRSFNIQEGLGVLDVSVSSNSEFTDVELDEIIIENQKYKSAKQITQLYNTLYLGSLEEHSEPSHQLKVNDIQLKFTSQPFSSYTQTYRSSSFNRLNKTFAHGEVYAIYFRVVYQRGNGKWHIIPGRLPEGNELDNLSDGYKRFQLEDTCQFNFSTNTGKFSYWENKDELYPDNGEYPNGKVRHFKFPSVRWMKENVYNSDPNYGSSYIDILGIDLVNPINLEDFKDCDGNIPIKWELGFAKRDEFTGLNLGQSILTLAVNRGDSNNYGETSHGINAEGIYQFNNARLVQNKVRTYPVEWLYNKLSPSVTHIRLEAQLTANLYSIPQYRNNGYEVEIVVGVLDYTANSSTIPTKKLIKVNKTQFVLNNTILEDVYNVFLEDTVRLELNENLNIPLATVDLRNTNIYTTILVTLLNIKNNCYTSFKDQIVIPCDRNVFNLSTINQGDSFIVKQGSIINYGLVFYDAGYTTDISPGPSFRKHNPINGYRFMHVFTYESLFNMNARWENIDNSLGYTYFYKGVRDKKVLGTLRGDVEPNAIIQGYSKDFNASNDVGFGEVYTPTNNTVTKHPFRIIRGQEINKESTYTGWTKFLPNDYYELPSTFGELVHLDSGLDFLIFHFKNALFTTKTTNYLEASGQNVFVGKGNIFEFPPVPVIHDTLGSLGTQHKWSCKSTKYGYFFVDSESKTVVKFAANKVGILSNTGLYNFFLENGECVGDNPFNSNGYIISLDEENKRLLITKKHLKLKDIFKNKFKGIWKNDQNFINSLELGDIVYKDNKYVKIV